MNALRHGRLTAWRKLDGGVRGIVVGDVFRRVVARTIAQQYTKKVEEATAPHQCALKTKAGCETVAHILQVLTDLDPDAMEGLRRVVDGEQILLFVGAFYGQPSTYLWEDDRLPPDRLPPDRLPPHRLPPDRPPPDRPPPDRPPPDRPKFRSFSSLSRHRFVLFVSLWVSSRGILVVFLKAGTLKCARLGSRAVV